MCACINIRLIIFYARFSDFHKYYVKNFEIDRQQAEDQRSRQLAELYL